MQYISRPGLLLSFCRILINMGECCGCGLMELYDWLNESENYKGRSSTRATTKQTRNCQSLVKSLNNVQYTRTINFPYKVNWTIQMYPEAVCTIKWQQHLLLWTSSWLIDCGSYRWTHKQNPYNHKESVVFIFSLTRVTQNQRFPWTHYPMSCVGETPCSLINSL